MNDPRLKLHPLGFLQAAQLPSSDELRTYYADRYYQQEQANYRQSYPADELAYFRLKTEQYACRAQSLRQSGGAGRFLDVGCGEGFALRWFADQGWEVEGLDFSSAGLEAMNPDLLPKADIGDLFKLLDHRIAGNQRFDVVWLKHVLEHVVDPVGLLDALKRILAPGGVLVVTVPNDGSALQEYAYRGGMIPDRFWIALPDHLSYFDASSLRGLAEARNWFVADMIADFPIDLFLLNSSANYVRDRSKGPDANRARIAFELLLGEQPHDRVNDFYRAMARVGIGRNLITFLQPRQDHD